MYTVILLSSRGNSVRQHAISRGHIFLFIGAILVLLLATVGAIGYGSFQKYQSTQLEEELQANTEEIKQLTDTKRKVESEFAAVNEEMRAIRRMTAQIRETLGILGQGGGSSTYWDSEDTDGQGTPQAENASTGIETEGHVSETPIALTPSLLRQEVQPLYNYINTRQKLIDGHPSILPVKLDKPNGGKHAFWYSSGFGWRRHPLTERREIHHGLDIKTRAGIPVIATADGTVTKVGNSGYLGKVVEIAHNAPQFKTLYAHLQGYANGLKEGQSVTRGQIIGYVGNTGRSTGAHLHYGVYDTIKGKWVNPMAYILDQQPTFSP